PMPVHAAVFDLEAKIGTRVLRAKAQRKQAARETYERGIDEGKALLLHEELLPGIHMLSVGQVGAGATIEVISRFAMAATHAGDRSTLRIPLSVGDVYGHSGLSDVDDLAHAPSEAFARLKVSAPGTTIALDGQPMVDGEARVSLARPIDLAFSNWAAPRTLEHCTAHGDRCASRCCNRRGSRGFDVGAVRDRRNRDHQASGGRRDTKQDCWPAWQW